MDDAFGHWLAGFIDGEGTFAINRQNVGREQSTYGCKLIVKLRDDDAPILEEIREKTGAGTICRKGPGSDGRTNNAQAAWQVQSRGDCLRMVEILDRYPLRAKKSRDYAVWREAVLASTHLRNGGNPSEINAPIWDAMGELRLELSRLHVYDATTASCS